MSSIMINFKKIFIGTETIDLIFFYKKYQRTNYNEKNAF